MDLVDELREYASAHVATQGPLQSILERAADEIDCLRNSRMRAYSQLKDIDNNLFAAVHRVTDIARALNGHDVMPTPSVFRNAEAGVGAKNIDRLTVPVPMCGIPKPPESVYAGLARLKHEGKPWSPE